MTGKYAKIVAVIQSSSTVSSCLSGYVNTLELNVEARYVEKISLCDGVDPYTMKNPRFSTDYKDLPNVEFPDISNYISSSKHRFTRNNKRTPTKALRHITFLFVDGYTTSR